MLHLYGDRVLPFASPTAEIAGALADLARGRGHSSGFADIAMLRPPIGMASKSSRATRAISHRRI